MEAEREMQAEHLGRRAGRVGPGRARTGLAWPVDVAGAELSSACLSTPRSLTETDGWGWEWGLKRVKGTAGGPAGPDRVGPGLFSSARVPGTPISLPLSVTD